MTFSFGLGSNPLSQLLFGKVAAVCGNQDLTLVLFLSDTASLFCLRKHGRRRSVFHQFVLSLCPMQHWGIALWILQVLLTTSWAQILSPSCTIGIVPWVCVLSLSICQVVVRLMMLVPHSFRLSTRKDRVRARSLHG